MQFDCGDHFVNKQRLINHGEQWNEFILLHQFRSYLSIPPLQIQISLEMCFPRVLDIENINVMMIVI